MKILKEDLKIDLKNFFKNVGMLRLVGADNVFECVIFAIFSVFLIFLATVGLIYDGLDTCVAYFKMKRDGYIF